MKKLLSVRIAQRHPNLQQVAKQPAFNFHVQEQNAHKWFRTVVANGEVVSHERIDPETKK